MTKYHLTALIEKEDEMFVALCPELDVASQGDTLEEARANLAEAVQLCLESASPTELKRRLHTDVKIMPLEVAVA
jgi:predicted RNase H-like HicB family nuclease